MVDWQAKLAECLELGYADLELIRHLDDLLAWQASIGNGDQNSFTAELLRKYQETGLREQFEEFLDQLIIANQDGYKQIFPTALNEKQAKTRYRQLIRVFHPDRGIKDEAWLNYRAEKINTAYQRYLDGEDDKAPGAQQASANQSSSTRPTAAVMPQFRYRPSIWRAKLGDAKTVQSRIVYGLAAISVVLIAVLYVSTLDFGPDTSVRDPVAQTLKSDAPQVDIAESSADSGLTLPAELLQDDDPLADFAPPEQSVSPDTPSVDSIEEPDTKPERIARAHELLERYQIQSPEPTLTRETRTNTSSDFERMVEARAAARKSADRREAERTQATAISRSESLPKPVNKPSEKSAGLAAVDTTSSRESAQPVAGEEPFAYLIPGKPVKVDVDPKIQLILDQFVNSFVAGDRDSLTRLYMSSARENNLRGIDAIRAYYGIIFGFTKARALDLRVSDIQQEDQYSAVVTGKVDIGTGGSQERLKYDTVDFKMVLVRTDRDYKIAVFNWKEIKEG